jgi:DNA-binding transcriptional ArsR family regulator
VKRTNARQEVDQRLVKALGHPLRVRLLQILNERVASPNELAKETGEPLGNVSYHVRLLADLACIELVRTAPRRGAVEHYYRATVPPWFDKPMWASMPASLRASVSHENLSIIFEETGATIRDGTFDSRPDNHVSRSPLLLDEQAWQELAELLDELLARAFELRAQAADRAVEAGTEDELISCSLVLMHYPTARAS